MSSMASSFFERATNSIHDVVNKIAKSESVFFNNDNFNSSEAAADLQSNDIDKKIDAMKRIWIHFSKGGEVTSLFSEVVRNAITPNMELRRLIHLFLVAHSNLASSDPKALKAIQELGLLAVNSFRRELSDRSQVARALSIRSMSTIRVLEITPVVIEALVKYSNDGSALVRRSVAVAAAHMVSHDTDQASFALDVVCRLLSDPDPCVCGAAVSAFNNIFNITINHALKSGDVEDSRSQGIEVLSRLHKLILRLFSFSVKFEPPHALAACELFTAYVKAFFATPLVTKDNHLKIHEHLEPLALSLAVLCSSSSSALVFSAASALFDIFDVTSTESEHQVILKDLNNIVNPIAYILKFAANCLVRALEICPRGAACPIVYSLHIIAKRHPSLLRPHLRTIAVSKIRDSSDLRLARLALLRTLTCQTNVREVLKELDLQIKIAQMRLSSSPEALQMNASGQPLFFLNTVTEQLQSLLRTVAEVAIEFPETRTTILSAFVKLLDSASPIAASEAVVALKFVLEKLLSENAINDNQPKFASNIKLSTDVVRQILKALPKLSSASARASSAWLIGAHIADLDLATSAEALRVLAANFPQEISSNVRIQTLHLAIRMFAMLSAAAPCVANVSDTVVSRVRALCLLVVQMGACDSSLLIRDLSRPLSALVEHHEQISTCGEDNSSLSIDEQAKNVVKNSIVAFFTSSSSKSSHALLETEQEASLQQRILSSSLAACTCAIIHPFSVDAAVAASNYCSSKYGLFAYDADTAHPADAVRLNGASLSNSAAVASMSSGHLLANRPTRNSGPVTSIGSSTANGGSRMGAANLKAHVAKTRDASSFFEDNDAEDCEIQPQNSITVVNDDNHEKNLDALKHLQIIDEAAGNSSKSTSDHLNSSSNRNNNNIAVFSMGTPETSPAGRRNLSNNNDEDGKQISFTMNPFTDHNNNGTAIHHAAATSQLDHIEPPAAKVYDFFADSEDDNNGEMPEQLRPSASNSPNNLSGGMPRGVNLISNGLTDLHQTGVEAAFEDGEGSESD